MTDTSALQWFQPLRLLLAIVVLVLPAVYEAVHTSAIYQDSSWLHLSIAKWMVTHRAIPRTGLFSQLSAAQWIDGTWGYDAVLGILWKLFGLRAVVILEMLGRGVLAVTLFWCAQRWRLDVWFGAILSISPLLLLPLHGPELFSAAALCCELGILLGSQAKSLFFLPLLFCLWANIHPSFVLGLAVFALYCLCDLVQHVSHRVSPSRSGNALSWRAAVMLLASVVASVVNPYGFGILTNSKDELYGAAGFEFLPEMSAPSFRSVSHYVVLLIVMFAFLLLGYKRTHNLFPYAAVACCTALGFRVQREMWLVVIVSLAVCAKEFCALEVGASSSQNVLRAPAVVLVAAIGVFLVPSDKILLERAGAQFPLRACQYVRSALAAQAPLFNAYRWGGFISWALPEYPVSMDPRPSLYHDELGDHFRVVLGRIPLTQDPVFTSARTILMPRDSELAVALTSIPELKKQFQVVYSDDISVVLSRQEPAVTDLYR